MCFNSLTDSSLLTLALFLIYFARVPNYKVEIVSFLLNELGLQVMTKAVLELPPSDSYKICVSFESLYGIWTDLPSVSLLITIPNVVKLLLIFCASFKPSPVTPVLDSLSDPAKSMRLSLPTLIYFGPSLVSFLLGSIELIYLYFIFFLWSFIHCHSFLIQQ